MDIWVKIVKLVIWPHSAGASTITWRNRLGPGVSYCNAANTRSDWDDLYTIAPMFFLFGAGSIVSCATSLGSCG